jgi:hypothetical protein
MLLVATLAMAEDKAHGRRARGWARFAFWLGATVSVAANVASVVVSHGPDPLSIAVSGWPPVCLLVVVEIMARPGKAKADSVVSPAREATPVPVPAPAPAILTGGGSAAPTQPLSLVDTTKPEQPQPPAPAAPSPAVVAARITPPRTPSAPASAAMSRPATSTTTRPQSSKKATPLARRPAPSATDTSVTAPDRARPATPVVTPELLNRVKAEADKYRTEHGTPISPGQIAVRLRVTSEQAQQALALLNLAPDSAAPSATVNGTRKASR